MSSPALPNGYRRTCSATIFAEAYCGFGFNRPDQQQDLAFGDGGSSSYGDVSSEYGPQQTPTRWTLRADGTVSTQRVAPTGIDNAVTAAGSRGALVSGYLRPQHLRTPDGGYVPMPAELTLSPADSTGTAVAASGTVAYTSSTDGLVHFLSCG